MARPPNGPLIAWNDIRTNVLNLIRAYLADNGGATPEEVQDIVATMIQDGTGISWAYDDVLGTLTGNVSITQYTDELAQDSVGNILLDTATINFTYDDATPTISAIVIDNSISNAKLADMSANRVKGRPGGIGTGDPVDLTMAQLGVVLDSDITNTHYIRSFGRAGGQTVYGGTSTGDPLVLRSNLLNDGGITAIAATNLDLFAANASISAPFEITLTAANAAGIVSIFAGDDITITATDDLSIEATTGNMNLSTLGSGADLNVTSGVGDLKLYGSTSTSLDTSSAGTIDLLVDNIVLWRVVSAGHFIAVTDNTIDIGASGATRPRTVYVGTSVISPVGTFATSVQTPTLNGNTASGGTLTLASTTDGTKGGIRLGADDWFRLAEITAPATPASGFVNEFCKTDGRPYFTDDTGYTQSMGLVPRDHIAGLLLSHAADTAHDITITVGEAQDKDRTILIVLASALTKQIDAAWAVGTNAGGMDTGAIGTNAVGHIHLIRRPDTGVVDALFSLSLTAPTMPANYTQRVYIGSVKTDGSSNILNGVWYDHGGRQVLFEWNTPTNDINTSTLSSTPATTTMNVITGLAVRIKTTTRCSHSSAPRNIRISQPGLGWTPSANVFSIRTGAGGVSSIGAWEGMTDTSGQLELEADGANTDAVITTHGWIQNRGASVSQG